jgi:hypothetical protein
VFLEFGYDPAEVSGIAFGLGTTRMAAQWAGVAIEEREAPVVTVVEGTKDTSQGTPEAAPVAQTVCEGSPT